MVRKSNHSPPTPPPTNELPPADIHHTLARLPDTIQWAVKWSVIPNNGQHISQAIEDGSAQAVSDGSLKELFGTTASILTAPHMQDPVTCDTIVPGPIKDGDSYHCELAGLISSVTLANEIAKHHQLPSGAITIACDNQATLRVFEPNFIPEPQEESFDLVSCLSHQVKNSVI